MAKKLLAIIFLGLFCGNVIALEEVSKKEQRIQLIQNALLGSAIRLFEEIEKTILSLESKKTILKPLSYSSVKDLKVVLMKFHTLREKLDNIRKIGPEKILELAEQIDKNQADKNPHLNGCLYFFVLGEDVEIDRSCLLDMLFKCNYDVSENGSFETFFDKEKELLNSLELTSKSLKQFFNDIKKIIYSAEFKRLIEVILCGVDNSAKLSESDNSLGDIEFDKDQLNSTQVEVEDEFEEILNIIPLLTNTIIGLIKKEWFKVARELELVVITQVSLF